MVKTIRQHDPQNMITVGVIPWAIHYATGGVTFYDPVVAENLDLVCIHVYPRADEAENRERAARISRYEIVMPVAGSHFGRTQLQFA